eukprot:TRINITY_DN42644_c1_g1_i1.p1 TRINITY_DN42644_c1_g1~~TRINITY_DN42644_c1_g1_i1.p1  ORF type:complete len:163 (-),score=47.54 TRINITY_DN42644_c1_g1_i1:24-512(-)
MSHSRKHVKVTVLQDTPEIQEDEKIAKVVELRGANICEVVFANGEHTLCQIPTKFRKLIWIKTGNFIIVREPKNIPNVKIRVMVQHVLFPDHIKNLRAQGKWPAEFEAEVAQTETKKPVEEPKKSNAGDSEDDSDLFYNPNHRLVTDSDDEDEDSEDEDDDE